MVGEDRAGSQFEVVLVKFDVASLLESAVGLGSRIAVYPHRIDVQAFTVGVEDVHDAVAGTEQGYQHEDAPCHGEAGQACAQLVAADGFPYFYENVPHGIIS